MKKKAEESVHVRLEMPIDKRKVILQTTIDTMQLMKRHENLIRIRSEKDKELTEFRRILSSITRMIKEVRMKELPLDTEDLKHVKKLKNESIMVPVVKKIEKVLKVKKAEAPVQKKPHTIDSQIDALQRKLQSL